MNNFWYKLEVKNDFDEWEKYGDYLTESDARIDREFAFAEDSSSGERREFRLTEYRYLAIN